MWSVLHKDDALESITCGGVEMLDLPANNEEDCYNMVMLGLCCCCWCCCGGLLVMLAHKNKIYVSQVSATNPATELLRTIAIIGTKYYSEYALQLYTSGFSN